MKLYGGHCWVDEQMKEEERTSSRPKSTPLILRHFSSEARPRSWMIRSGREGLWEWDENVQEPGLYFEWSSAVSSEARHRPVNITEEQVGREVKRQ